MPGDKYPFGSSLLGTRIGEGKTVMMFTMNHSRPRMDSMRARIRPVAYWAILWIAVTSAALMGYLFGR